MKALLLSTAIATFAVIGSATAEPTRLSTDQMDQVVAGTRLNLSVFKNVAIQKLKNIKINAELRSKPDIRGNLAEAEAGANAKGRHTFTETLTLADVVQGRSSSSFSESVAATAGGGKRHHRPCRSC